MSNWITITEEHIKTRLAGPELVAFKSAALAEGQTGADVLADVTSQVVDRVRGYCAQAVKGGYLKEMGAAGTVPSRLVNVTANIIRYELATRLPGMRKLIDELRQKQQDRDVQLLEQVASGKFAAEDPEGEETAVSVPSPTISGRTKQYGRDSQDGI
ncbi:MAG: hypothetical protein Fur0032_20950 [Terrimicrobiaceae bacterium]